MADAIPLRTPLVVYVEPSGYCNLQCQFCPQYIDPSKLTKVNMSLDSFYTIARNIKEFPDRVAKLRFCGTGEPLFNKNFLEMARVASEMNLAINIEVITNGILLNREMSDLVGLVDKIIISVEGLCSDDYKEYCGKSICYESLLENIKRLYDIKDRRAIIHAKIHRTALKGMVSREEKFYDDFGSCSDEVYIEDLVNMWPEAEFDLGQIENKHRFFSSVNEVKACPQIFKGFQINADGKVISCCVDWQAKNQIGHLSESTLLEIWHGRKLKELQKKHLQGHRGSFDPCSGCSMNEYCDTDNIDQALDDLIDKI